MKEKTKSNKFIFLYIFLVLLILLVASFFVVPRIIGLKKNGFIIVNGNSMAPTLNDGEKILYKKTDSFKRFDIIVFKYDSNTLIKRIYGLPGETIVINNGKIYIDSIELIDDNYAYNYTDGDNNIILGDNQYFVLGDNREISLDSRHFGPIDKKGIKGIVISDK